MDLIRTLSALTLLTIFSTSANAHDSLIKHHPRAARDAVWSSFGCYTDVSTSRSLMATFTSDDHGMTVEKCIAFCDSGNYIFAGLEFGQECYCDSTIQAPSIETPISQCSTPCTSNANETCGGSGRLNVWTNGLPGPVLVQNVSNSNWAYQGCFTDSIGLRTLQVPVAIPGGVTAETCTAACQTEGYTLAGLEDGHECWCDNVAAQTTQHVSDNDCRAVCSANHSEYCGNANRLATYRLSTSGGPTGPTDCTTTDVSNFTLEAVYNVPPVGGPPSLPLKVVLVEMVPTVTWGILSACTLCCTDWPTFSLQNSVFLPHSLSNPLQLMVSSAPGDGESPNFVASIPAFPGFQSYCATANPDITQANSLLAFGGKTDSFSLCANNTANGRLDVVFTPVTGHPHYTLDSCNAVTIQINQ